MSDIQEPIDALIARCLRGDQTAYAALYDQLSASVYRLCYSVLLNREDAEDVTQETFVYAFKNLRRYDPAKSALKTWLFTIAICRCRNLYRRARPTTVDIAELVGGDPPAPHSERPEAAWAQRNASEAVAAALTELSPRLREAIMLRHGHGLTYREIADIMDCPQKTAESRVRLAHDALRRKLNADGPGLLDELLSF